MTNIVKDDGEAAKLEKTLATSNPAGGICVESSDVPDLPVVEDSQSAEDVEMGARVSGDGGDDMSVTLAELSSKRLGKRGDHHLIDVASRHGDSGSTDEKIDSPSVSASVSGGGGDDSVILRRSSRKKIDVDFAELSGKMKKIKEVEKEKDDGEQRPVDDQADQGGDDDEEEEDSEFSVGEFVWGKVKSHPWWPGRVYDPKDASEAALSHKHKHDGRFLVAYFGDDTYAWCDEPQMKLFVENFAEMSKQSSSKSFLNAVEEAVAEFSRLVELDMTCYCTPRSDQGSEVASNAGIKGGVKVDKGGIGMHSVERFNPTAFLDNLRTVGKQASVDSLLDLMTLKSKVSAVYRPKDGSMLLKFSEMQENSAEDEVLGEGTEDTIRGPVEESVHILSAMPDALLQAKRKERSVAEILYGDEKASEDGDVVVEGEKSTKTASESVRKRRKVTDESEKNVGDQEESVEDETLIIHQSGKKKKKLEEISKVGAQTKTVDGGKPGGEKKVGSRSSKMKVKHIPKPIVVEAPSLSAFEETEMTPRTRDRKKSKYLSPPYTNFEYYRQTSINSPRAQEVTKAVETSNASQSGGTSSKSVSAKVSAPLVKCSDETSKKNLPKEVVVEHGKPNGSVPVTPRRASTRKTGGIASSDNVLSEIRSAALSGQLSKEDAVKGFLSSYRSSKYQNESSPNPREADDQLVLNDEEKNLKKSGTKWERIKLKNKGKAVDLGKDGLEGEATEDGSKSLKKSERSKLKKKAKEVNTEADAVEESKSMKKSEAKHEKSKMENKAEEVIPEKDGNRTESTQSAALHLKFPAGYPLPSVDDLGALYGRFGALEISKTKVIEKSSSAKLVFLRGSDAEAACKSSNESSPFGEAEVGFEIRYLKAESEKKEVDKNGYMKKDASNSESQKRKRSTKKQSKASTADGELKILKQKLEGMATMVAEAVDGKVSSDLKLNLESRLKDLLEEVKALPALPSSSASGV